MARSFRLPDLGEGIHEGEIVSILVSTGDEVSEGEPILVIETDKATVEIPSPYTGVVAEINVKPGQIVEVGQVLLSFNVVETIEKEVPEEVASPLAEKEVEISNQAAAARPVATRPEDSTKKSRPVPASPATRRIARELGVDLHHVTPSGPAGLVTAEDVHRAAAEAQLVDTPRETAERQPLGPAPETTATGAWMSGAEPPPLPDFSRWGTVQRQPLRSIRRATARQMALAWSQIPHVTHQETADVTQLESFRQKHKAQIEAIGGKLTISVFALKAVVAGLKTFPRFNASLDMARQEVVLKQYYHIGVAVETEKGLVVPVIRDVDRKSISELAVELHHLVTRVREGKIRLEDLKGGTFTITNIGPLGGTGFTPIINYPEVAILGLGQARWQPVVLGNQKSYQIVPRLTMPLVLAFDHRILDGADAARFTNLIISGLENPEKLLMMV